MSITIFLQKITQNALTPEHPSNNDRFADDAVEEVEETDTLLLSMYIRGRPLCNLQFAHDIDLLEGSEVRNSNKSLKDWTKNSCWIGHGNQLNLFLAVFQQLPKPRGRVGKNPGKTSITQPGG